MRWWSRSRRMAGCPTVPGRTPRRTLTAAAMAATTSCSGPRGGFTPTGHGIHVCANVACGPDGTAAAVLLRAAAIEDGAELATSRRGQTVRAVALARGPGNLCAALGITMADNGIDLFDPSSPVRLRLNDTHRARSGPRVGVSQAADRPWRLWLTGRPEVSAYRRSSRAPARGASD